MLILPYCAQGYIVGGSSLLVVSHEGLSTPSRRTVTKGSFGLSALGKWRMTVPQIRFLATAVKNNL
uniref:Uncharacterized protein n=1 Tax=uncultured marine bacterium 581 TaxID=257401 RepID=Q6SFC9_9BACT|nr:hypothetical protein MBMO_EBAC000-69B03.40 [uncultured marine bacterium 581]